MTVDTRSRNARPRIQREMDDAFIRQILRGEDYVITLAALATIGLIEEPHALDLICDLVELRAGRAPEHVLQAWGARARQYLHRLIGDTAEPERLVN